VPDMQVGFEHAVAKGFHRRFPIYPYPIRLYVRSSEHDLGWICDQITSSLVSNIDDGCTSAETDELKKRGTFKLAENRHSAVGRQEFLLAEHGRKNGCCHMLFKESCHSRGGFCVSVGGACDTIFVPCRYTPAYHLQYNQFVSTISVGHHHLPAAAIPAIENAVSPRFSSVADVCPNNFAMAWALTFVPCLCP